MDYFKARFNHGDSAPSTGLMFSMCKSIPVFIQPLGLFLLGSDTVGGMIGPFFAGPLTDRLGRKLGMVIGSIVICLGSAIIASAPSQPQFVGGRFILGFGVSILTVRGGISYNVPNGTDPLPYSAQLPRTVSKFALPNGVVA